jgi:hypothetical protein
MLAAAEGQLTPLFGQSLEFRDPVSSNKWNCADQSRDGEYMCGCAAMKDQHVIRIWEAGSGALAVVLEGPPVGLHSVSWLPSPSRYRPPYDQQRSIRCIHR